MDELQHFLMNYFEEKYNPETTAQRWIQYTKFKHEFMNALAKLREEERKNEQKTI